MIKICLNSKTSSKTNSRFAFSSQAPSEVKFDDLFGTSAAIDPFNFNSQNGMRKDDKWVS